MSRIWIAVALLGAACQAIPASPPARLLTASETVSPAKPFTLVLAFNDPRTGRPVTRFQPEHGKDLHLVITSADLATFAHVHPTARSDGRFELRLNQTTRDPDNQDAAQAVPKPGTFFAFAEYRPEGQDEQLTRLTLDAGPAAAPTTPTPDPPRKRIGPYDVALDVQRGPETLSFRFDVKLSGEPVTDWEPWLGMAGHAIVIGAAGTRVEEKFFRHLHLDDDGSFPMEPPPPGLYRIWGQFKRGGRVLTFPFTVRL